MARLAPAFMFLVFVATVEAAAGQAAPYKIVVLAGEDSVNVIQQKSAVAPLVEVRDRNNQPVSGVVVTFAVQGGKAAAFQGGATTITVATNAAGQAAATGLTPLTAGAVHISVEAAVQGQVVSAAMTQVNVMTAAEAAAAAGTAGGGAGSGTGAAGGGAAGGGGGISATTIGVIGGVAAAGAVAGTQVLGGGGRESYSGAFAITVTNVFGACTRQSRYSGTLEVDIESHDTGASLDGAARISGAREEFVSSTCPGPAFSNPWGMPEAPVRGTDAALAFEASDVVAAGDGSGNIARNYKFAGSVSGATIAGTFELSWIHQVVAGARFTERQAVTLSKP